MKLYYKAGACSLSPHIVLLETDLEFSTESVDLATKVTETGANFYDINPKGQVPTLLLDDGTVLTEGVAIVQYIADKVPEEKLLAPVGDVERYQTISWLNFISAELHKNFSPLFYKSSDEVKAQTVETLKKKFSYVDSILAKQDYIMGKDFTVADAYLFTVLGWMKAFPSFPVYPSIERYMEQMRKRPSVISALKKESRK